MLAWFAALAALGIPHILDNPHVLVAVNPAYAASFCLQHKWVAFVALGAVVLVMGSRKS